jgi:RNA polymerase sigma-70 factor, ECF subfamily
VYATVEAAMCDPHRMSDADDVALVSLLRSGCDDALREVDRRYRRPLYAYARRLLAGSGHDPEDAVQEALLRAWASLREDAREPRLAPWLYRVLHNHSLDLLRRAPDPTDGSAPAPHVRDAAEEAIARERISEIAAAIDRLPERQRCALVRHVLGGESHEAIARALSTTPKASKVLVLRARRELRGACRLHS